MQKLIDVANIEIGVTEFPKDSNRTKYGLWFGYDGNKWCGMFVSWVCSKAGFPLGKIDFTKGFAGCAFALNHFRAKGEIVQKPQPGDIFIVDWQGDGKPDHTGFFIRDLGNGSFETIEGNTGVGNDSNGGKVMKRVRYYKTDKAVWFFIHPKVFDTVPAPVV